MIIKSISARKILASLGNETVEATIKFEDGSSVSASVPAGISAGKYEIKKSTPDLAVDEINKMGVFCAGKSWTQEKLDAEISSHGFGGNATLAVSATFFRALSVERIAYSKMPKMMVLMFEGGEHGNKNLTIQEFMVICETVDEAKNSFSKVREYLKTNNIETTVGAEGGFSPSVFSNTEALDVIKKVLPDKNIALDVAGCFESGEKLDFDKLLGEYNIISIEDPYNDEDWENWANFYQKYGQKIMVVGDDLTTTNADRVKMAVDKKTINAIIVKPNQIGTISAAVKSIKVARENDLKIVVSHRGEETDDSWIVDFALSVRADYVKLGGVDRGERIAKYNRILELSAS